MTFKLQSPRQWFGLLLAVVTALTLLRWMTLWLTPVGLQGDEAQYWSWSLDWAFGYFSKPPVIAWIIGSATAICGEGPACIRTASPLIHGGTALLLYFVGKGFFDQRVGFWAGLLYITLPGVAFSSHIMSTDVPLLFFCALALLALERWLATRKLSWAVLLGLAWGLGLLSKYAMVFSIVATLLYCLFSPTVRAWVWRSLGLYGALVLAFALLLPNLIWNLNNGWLTFEHTLDNAKLDGPLLHLDKGFEFFGAQFGVFGPLPFACLLLAAWWALRRDPRRPPALLLWLSLPIVLVITVEAFLSRAHANWAASAYVAGSLAVAAMITRPGWDRWRRGSFVLHALFVLFIVPVAVFPQIVGPQKALAQMAGWPTLRAAVIEQLENEGLRMVMSDHRRTTAQLIYQFHGLQRGEEKIEVVSWDLNNRIDNHFDLTRPYDPKKGPALLVTRYPDRWIFAERLCQHRLLGDITRPDGFGGGRRYRLILIEGPCEEK